MRTPAGLEVFGGVRAGAVRSEWGSAGGWRAATIRGRTAGWPRDARGVSCPHEGRPHLHRDPLVGLAPESCPGCVPPDHSLLVRAHERRGRECDGRWDMVPNSVRRARDRILERRPSALPCASFGRRGYHADAMPEGESNAPRSSSGDASDEPGVGAFRGTSRFRVDRVLGSGGMGVVYQAFDHASGAPVALKTLKNWGAQDLYRLKNEFRQLAEVRHTNLVQLHELVCDEGVWFVSMELVQGIDFLSYARSSPTSVDPVADTYDGPAEPLYDARRLTEATRQTATALHELHKRQKVHRDLKPHNVLVTPAGRVVVLDFGLVADATDGQATASSIAGTPAYMAPEQVTGTNIGPPADLYALGVMLYEALTGQLPFTGTAYGVMLAKQQGLAAPPSAVHRAVEPEWERLCLALLHRDPEARPTASDVLTTLGAVPTYSREDPGHPFVGREGELRTLHATLEATRKGQPILVHVEGPSGVGKTTVIKEFLQSKTNADVVALVARCYERESIPYKAVDGLVDSLTRHLVRSGSEAEALLPRDIHTLTRVFPVLLRADAVARAPRVGAPAADAQELRRRAFAALKELLGRLADRRRLVLWIDDLQWDDADSAALLSSVLSAPDPPALLLVATCRSEEAGRSACIQALRKALTPDQVHHVPLDPLTRTQATELALRLLGTERGTRERSEQIARESEGSPLFVGALAQRLREADQQHSPSLAELLHAQVEQLPRPARRLLEVLVVEGRPVAQILAFRASGLGPEGREALAALRAAHLARTGGTSEHDSADVFHGRIRDVVAASMTNERARECHLELARALEAHGRVDHERMALHLFAAGEVQRAATHARIAGDEAAQALAFGRAIEFYRKALAGTGEASDWELQTKLAGALANAGRNGEAGDRYLAAARAAPPHERTALLKEASFHLLSSARASEGMAVAREALADVGLSMPETPRRALFSLMRRRAWLRLRGLRYRPTDPRSISPLTLTRIDLCWSLALGLMNVDLVRCSDFATRGLLLALESGDPFRVGRAIVLEANTTAAAGPSSQAQVEKLLAIADEHAERLGDPYLRSFSTAMRGIAHFWRAEWAASARLLTDAARIMAEIPGTSFEFTVAQTVGLLAHYLAGDIDEMLRGVAALRARVQAGADPYLRFRMIDVSHLEALVLDRPSRGREDIAETMADRVDEQEGAGGPFLVWLLLQAQVRIALYEGKGAEAYRVMAERGPELEKSLLLRPPLSVIIYNHLLGLAALAATHEGAMQASEAQAILKRVGRALGAVDMPFAKAAHALIEAGYASVSGETSRTAEALDRAIAGFEHTGTALFAAAAKRRRGELTGGDEGRALVRDADAWMRSHSIRDPERMARICAPRVCT
ncbi:MAG: protein kinase [Myxococcales bacterium]|nr:protein kinase [Myxococcales bacterium]